MRDAILLSGLFVGARLVGEVSTQSLISPDIEDKETLFHWADPEISTKSLVIMISYVGKRLPYPPPATVHSSPTLLQFRRCVSGPLLSRGEFPTRSDICEIGALCPHVDFLDLPGG